jgi:hypothetical protein
MQNNMCNDGPTPANHSSQTGGTPKDIASEYASTNLNVGNLFEALTPS